jgi:hypothetical protein
MAWVMTDKSACSQQSITTKRSSTSWRKMRKASAGAFEDESWLKQVCKWLSVGAPGGNSGSSCA